MSATRKRDGALTTPGGGDHAYQVDVNYVHRTIAEILPRHVAQSHSRELAKAAERIVRHLTTRRMS